jgi:hypothetical protein
MANLGMVYNADNAPQMDFEPLPAGDYTMAIMESEIKISGENSKYPGIKYLNLTFEVVDGKGTGRKVFHILNLWSPSEKSAKIAEGELGAIQKAIGAKNVSNSSELHGKPLVVKLAIQPARDGYDASNKAKAFKALGGVQTQNTATPAPSDDWKTESGGIVPPPGI